MKLGRISATIGQISLIAALAIATGCSKRKEIAKVEKAKPTATPISKPTPHVYKLGEPRPIVLNVDKPLIVPAASPTPPPRPADKH